MKGGFSGNHRILTTYGVAHNGKWGGCLRSAQSRVSGGMPPQENFGFYEYECCQKGVSTQTKETSLNPPLLFYVLV